MPRPLFTPGKDTVPIVQEAGWAPGPVWTGAENLAPTGIRSPDRATRSQSVYRLSYSAHIRSPDRPARSQSLCRLRYPAHITEITLWYFEEAVEELRMTMFKCCNSELQIKKKRRQLRWPNAYDHREVIQSNTVAVALARHKHKLGQVKAKCPAIKTD